MKTSTMKSSKDTSITSLASYVLGGAVAAVSGLFGFLVLRDSNEKFMMLKKLRDEHGNAISLMSGKDLLNAVNFYFDQIKGVFLPRYDVWPEMYDRLADWHYTELETIIKDNPGLSADKYICEFAAGGLIANGVMACSSVFISAVALTYIWHTYDQNKAIDMGVKLRDIAPEDLDSTNESDISNAELRLS